MGTLKSGKAAVVGTLNEGNPVVASPRSSKPAVVGTLKSRGKAVVATPKSATVVAKLEKSGIAVVIGPKSPNGGAVVANQMSLLVVDGIIMKKKTATSQIFDNLSIVVVVFAFGRRFPFS